MSVKERITKYIEYKKITKIAFCSAINVSNAFISSMRQSIQPDKIQRIALKFPDLNTGWLLTGEGEMLKSPEISPKISSIEVLLLPISAQAGSLNDFLVSVKGEECEKIICPIKGADFAITVSGDSMSPEFPNGTQIFIKKINEKAFIDWGRSYVLDTCNGIVLKKIVPSIKEGNIKCISVNPDPIFAPFEISLNDVFGVYRVLLSMSIK